MKILIRKTLALTFFSVGIFGYIGLKLGFENLLKSKNLEMAGSPNGSLIEIQAKQELLHKIIRKREIMSFSSKSAYVFDETDIIEIREKAANDSLKELMIYRHYLPLIVKIDDSSNLTSKFVSSGLLKDLTKYSETELRKLYINKLDSLIHLKKLKNKKVEIESMQAAGSKSAIIFDKNMKQQIDSIIKKQGGSKK